MRPVGRFVVPEEHPALPGHFPGRPIVPGVVLLDHAMALIGAEEGGREPRFLPGVRFTRPVLPGQEVEVRYENGRFECRVGELGVLSGTVVFG